MQTETKDRSILDPANATKQALASLSFVPNHKSVLLKHGSIVLHNVHSTANTATSTAHNDLANERHLMLFSHGFVVADVAVVHAFRLFLALNDQDIIMENSFLDYLHAKLFEEENVSSGECKVGSLAMWDVRSCLVEFSFISITTLTFFVRNNIISIRAQEKVNMSLMDSFDSILLNHKLI